MPSDSKRNFYQEESLHPQRFVTADPNVSSAALLMDNGLRNDGRKAEDPRPLFMETGVVTRGKGSAYVEMGSTKVICACYGPKQLQNKEISSFNKGLLVSEFRFASFASTIRKTDQLGVTEKEWSSLIVDALSPAVVLESFPKAQVDIYITVLEDGGSALAAAIGAASLALADAGIEMYGLVSAASLLQLDELILIDPTFSEEQLQKHTGIHTDRHSGHLTISLLNGLSQLTMISQQGHMKHHDMAQGVTTLKQMCLNIHPVMQRCLYESIKRKHQNT